MAQAVKKYFDISLDISAPMGNRGFTVVEGDTGNILRIALTDSGEPVDLTGCRIIAVFSKSNGIAAQDSSLQEGGVLLQGSLNNEVHISLFPASFAPGMVECELQIYSDSSLSTLVTTAKFNFNCRPAMLREDTMTASGELPMLRAMMDALASREEEALAAALQAEEAAARCLALLDGHITTFLVHRYREETTD